jgi:hypothetical protein
LVSLLVTSVSQPVFGLSSQSLKPSSHVIPQVKSALHTGVPWKLLHSLWQTPQLSVEVSSVSQPFIALLSQSAVLLLQKASVHDPPLQRFVPQSVAQSPQCFGSLRRFTSQPAFLSQSASQPLQPLPSPHSPLMQSCSSAQLFSQLPQ